MRNVPFRFRSFRTVAAAILSLTMIRTESLGQSQVQLVETAPSTASFPHTEVTIQQRLESLESQLQDQQAVIDYQQDQILDLQASEPISRSTGLSIIQPKQLQKFEIGGQYRMLFNSSNFGFHPQTISGDQPNSTYVNQRFRTWMTVNASEHVRGYVQAEMGHILWGDDFDFPKTYTVAPPRDRAGVELRFGYLEYESNEFGILRAGIQPWDDRFNEMLASSTWDFSVGGLKWRKQTSEGLDLSAGIFQLNENDIQLADDAYLVVTDADIIDEEAYSLGVSGYFLPDRGNYSYPTAPAYDSAWDAWLGIRSSVNLGFGKLNSFAIYNTGARDELGNVATYRHDGAAFRAELAGLQLGPGKWSTQVVYSTGDRDQNGNHSNEFRTIAQSARDNFGAQSYWGYLVTSSPHGPSDVDDQGVSLQNRGLGLFTVQTKYDYPIFERLTGTSAFGWLRSDAINPTSRSREMGSELVQAFSFDFGGGLKMDYGAAVFFTGDFYRTSPASAKPNDLYEAFTRIQLEF